MAKVKLERPRIAFYTRISTDEDHQKYSLDAQKDRLEAFCKAQWGEDWTLYKLYRDTESGTHMDRPALQEMLSEAEQKAFDTLLVFRVDRLSRKVRELALMVDELTRQGITLRSITEPFDTSTAAGKMMLQMLGVFAEFEHATIVERTRVGMERKVKGGQWHGGQAPYGYQFNPEKRLVVSEEEALVVHKMFRMYSEEEKGAFSVANALNDAGYRKRTGKKWDRRVVLHILRNPLYIGKMRWREVEYDGNHDPIISEELFNQAADILRARAEDMKGRQWHNGNERLLAGIARCARCGSPMFGGGGQKNGTYIHYYVCSKRMNRDGCDQAYVRADLLEAAIVQDIKTMLMDDHFMSRAWEATNQKLAAERPDLDKEIERLDVQMAETQRRMDRYFGAFEAGTMEPTLCNHKVKELDGQLQQLVAEKQNLEARRERLDLPALDMKAFASLVDRFEEVFAAGTNAQKKHLLHNLVKKVLIHDRRTVEVWYALPNPERFENWNTELPRKDSNLRPSD